MDQRTLQVLEYPKVLAQLAKHTSFAVSRALAEQLTPSVNIDEISLWQAMTSEARKLLELKGSVSIGGARDILSAVERSRLGGLLEPAELLDIHSTILAARSVRNAIAKLSNQLPILADVAQGIVDRTDLEREIGRCINDRGEVVDEASPALRAIRAEIRSSHGRLMQRLNDLLASSEYRTIIQEPIITMREGRYVIPVKADSKGQIRGVVHDQSASGATLFMEPLVTVDLNNRWRESQLAEQREVDKILRGLSSLVAAAADELEDSLAALGEIDLALAKARYSTALNAVEPRVVERNGRPGAQGLLISNARHPLLVGDVVPISVWLGDEFAVLVITGPNTGGKTVALKTVGLLTLMAQAGLHIPADEGSRIRVFESIYADIGDEQSIEQSLSTFSSHMTHIVDILSKADEDSLVLLDELGAGTDPAEGSALARSILSEILSRGTWTIATTHYPELKAYAHTTPGVENASVEFDLETLAPTFKLNIGLPGMSNALAIATRLGLSNVIVEAARKLLNPNEVQVESLLASIRDERARTVAELTRAEEARIDAEKLRQRLQAQYRDIDEERQRLTMAARQELAAEIDGTRRRLRELVLAAERSSRQAQDIATARETLKQVEKDVAVALPEPRRRVELPEEQEASGELRPGDTVKVRSLDEVGELVSVNTSRREAEVQLGSFKLKLAMDDLERSRKERPEYQQRSIAGYSQLAQQDRPAPRVDLEIRGRRAEEVAPELDKYLDEAYLAGLPYVRIIHGKGTGVLRQVVREILSSHPLVRSFRSADVKEGGEGVTVAVFTGQ